jgi:thiamine-monophosphate kinase
MKINKLGEFGFIEQLAKMMPVPQPPLKWGIGDDCAVYELNDSTYGLLTTDMLIEKVHFSRNYASAYQIGWKAAACNISDIASMGGSPQYMLVSIGLPGETEVSWAMGLYQGMLDIAQKYGVSIVGGDTVTAPQIVINIALTGHVPQTNLCLRSGAQIGDVIMVSGELGGSAAGLYLFQHQTSVSLDMREYLLQKHFQPEPRTALGRWIGAQLGHGAMTDSSDGLARDLLSLAAAGKVGFLIQESQLPIHPWVRSLAEATGQNALNWAMNGGEDYELVFTVPQNQLEYFSRGILVQLGIPVTPIGMVVAMDEGIQLQDSNGNISKLNHQGYEHFFNTH